MNVPVAFSRRMAQAAMTETCTIRRVTVIPDNFGGQTEVETLTVVPCRVEADSSQPVEIVQGGAVTAVGRFKFYLPSGTDVIPADTILYQGASYEMVDDNEARTDSPCLTVMARRAS
jgi:hypothetical protein